MAPPINENTAENNKDNSNNKQESSPVGLKRPAIDEKGEDESSSSALVVPAAPKRARNDVDNDKHDNEEEEDEVLDLAKTLGFKAGDRFEVQWEIHTNDDDDDQNQDTATAAVDTPRPQTRWWGATLLEHDGRTEDSVAIRTLDYDPYPQGGFPERSQEDVIFLGKDTLVNPVTHDELTYRLEGEDTEAVCVGREQIEQVVNDTLMKAMSKNASAWGSMSSAQQAFVASMVAEKKEKLVDLLLNHGNGVVTSTDMKAILARTMEDNGNTSS